MKTGKRITRKEFLKGTGIALLGTLLGHRAIADVEGTTYPQDPTLTPWAYLPVIRGTSTQGSARVVHVHSTQATNWDFGDDYYGSFVDQDAVNAIMDEGVTNLTGASSVTEAWRELIPNYQPGKAIAVKVNFNNSFYCNRCLTSCEDYELAIDALIHPVNALIRGLQLAYPSLDYSDIWIYDATIGKHGPDSASNRGIPGNRFRDNCLYSGVQFFDAKNCDKYAGYESSDPTAYVTWRNPPHIPTPGSQKVTDVLVNASYVINMPIMKYHGSPGATLSFKNHFGSIANCEPLHEWISVRNGPYYAGTSYSPLVDIYRNPHILNKTVLIIGDALFGNWDSNRTKPTRWRTFNDDAANSLFLSTDPVAIDSVMTDFIDAEKLLFAGARDVLIYAESVGLGVFEQGDPWQEPWGSGYSQIDYRRVEL